MYLQKVISRKAFFYKLVFCWHVEVNDEIPGSGSGFMSQWHGFADPDPDPDPHLKKMSWIRNTGFKAREQDITWLVLCQHTRKKGRKAAKNRKWMFSLLISKSQLCK
jgi:hypothetical protein